MAECKVEGCDRPVRCRGWCEKHYRRWRRRGTTDDFPTVCKINDEDCCGGPLARGMCQNHYKRWKAHGAPLAPSERGKWLRIGPKTWPQYYNALHERVRTERGNADHCIIYLCDTGSTKFEWANISHEYKDVGDFMPMCQIHHAQYDGKPSRVEALAA